MKQQKPKEGNFKNKTEKDNWLERKKLKYKQAFEKVEFEKKNVFFSDSDSEEEVTSGDKQSPQDENKDPNKEEIPSNQDTQTNSADENSKDSLQKNDIPSGSFIAQAIENYIPEGSTKTNNNKKTPPIISIAATLYGKKTDSKKEDTIKNTNETFENK